MSMLSSLKIEHFELVKKGSFRVFKTRNLTHHLKLSQFLQYLRSARPLLDDENYDRMRALADEFQRGIGIKLQRYLMLKSWWSSNYVSDWWEEYVYLRGRSPIMVNSNFYGIDAILMHPTKVQSARAASVIHSCLQYRRLIERQELEPVCC